MTSHSTRLRQRWTAKPNTARTTKMKNAMKTETNPTDKATARPWHVAHNATVVDTIHSGSGQIAQMSNGAMNNLGADAREANAALIVRAVNEYDALVVVAEAHTDLLRHVINFQKWIRDGDPCGKFFVNLDTSRDGQALANLAAVRGGK